MGPFTKVWIGCVSFNFVLQYIMIKVEKYPLTVRELLYIGAANIISAPIMTLVTIAACIVDLAQSKRIKDFLDRRIM